MIADYHVHSHYSDDSFYEMEQVVQDAIARQLDEICFTDHVDYGVKNDWHTGEEIRYFEGLPILNVDYEAYFRQIGALQAKYRGQIVIRQGLEFGVQTHTIPKFQKLTRQYDLDFIILSIHQIADLEFWNQAFQQGKTQKEYNDGYYQGLYEVITQYHDYSVVGHLDLIKRYDKQGDYPLANNQAMITRILATVIRDGKGIEVNTSSFRYGIPDLMPSRAILKLYHDLGGRIITIGSDSHKPEYLGAHIQDVKADLQALGFTQFCTYERMIPTFHML